MTTIDWGKIFAVYPNDPDEHLVAGDYYEDLQDMARAAEHRRRAAFWAWVKRAGCSPDPWGSGWWWHLRESGWITLVPTACCVPEEVFLRLGKDDQGQTGKNDDGLVYPTERDAWEELYRAWSTSPSTSPQM